MNHREPILSTSNDTWDYGNAAWKTSVVTNDDMYVCDYICILPSYQSTDSIHDSLCYIIADKFGDRFADRIIACLDACRGIPTKELQTIVSRKHRLNSGSTMECR